MSIDLSDARITAVRQAIADPSDPTSWFILHYSPTPTSPQTATASLLAKGEAPVVPSLQGVLAQNAAGAAEEDVLFAYGEIGGKGLVLLFLKDSVGGVRRARAVVHSRAVASLFPDYSALITIAHPSQLTEELVVDKLGLNHPSHQHQHQGQGQGHHPAPLQQQQRHQQQTDQRILPPPRQTSLATKVDDNAAPQHNLDNPPAPAIATTATGSQSPSTAQHHYPVSPARPSHTSTPVKSSVHHNHTHDRDPVVTSGIGIGTGTVSLDSPQPSPTLKYQGISSADYFKDDPSRVRKTSLTSRFKNTFQRSTSASASSSSYPSTTTEEPTPSSPSSAAQPTSLSTAASPNANATFGGGPASPPSPAATSRFKSSSLAKAFHRRRSSGNANGLGNEVTPPTSPQIDEFGRGGYTGAGARDTVTEAEEEGFAPPVPPKDLPASPAAFENSATASQATLGHGHPDLGPALAIPVPTSSSSGNAVPPREDEASTARSVLSPSPSAKQALFDARQKSLTHENAIQERFRRDQEDRARRAAELEDDGDDDRSVRLAYDESDEDDQSSIPDSGAKRWLVGVDGQARHEVEDRSVGGLPHPPAGQNGAESVPGAGAGKAQGGEQLQMERLRMEEQEGKRAHEEQEQGWEELEERERQEAEEREQIFADEKARREEEARQRRMEEERMRVDQERSRALEVETRHRQEEEERAKTEAEEREREAEAVQRRRLEEEAEAERQRLEKEEAERRRLEEEAESERRRLEEEEEQRRLKENEEAERRRIELENETRRLEAEANERRRLAMEEEENDRKRAEEETRVRLQQEAEEAEAEKRRKEKEEERVARKALVKEGLTRGRKEGGVMLRGWVTAQTFKSMTWRRRYFHLMPSEMQLYKSEGDAKPIQVIHFGPHSTVSEQYEESQVKDSFKVVSDGPKGPEEFFLFTDSGEDKEVVLEGIRLCLSS